MTPDEFNHLLRSAVGVIAAVHESRAGRLSDAEHKHIVAGIAAEAGGFHMLVPVLAAHCLTLAKTVADDNDVPIEEVITALGLHTAHREVRRR